MIPAVSFVFVDEMEGNKKIRIFVLSLSDFLDFSKDTNIGFINPAQDGINIRYTEGKSAHWLSHIRCCNQIAYFEMQFNVLEETELFLET